MRRDTSLACLVEAESTQRVPGQRNGGRSEVEKWRIGFERPGAEIAEEGAHVGQPGMRGTAHLVTGVRRRVVRVRIRCLAICRILLGRISLGIFSSRI